MSQLEPYHLKPLQSLQRFIEAESVESHDVVTKAKAGYGNHVRSFIPNGRVEKHLHEPETDFRRVKALLGAIFDSKNTHFEVSARDVAVYCPKVFCILFRIGKAAFIGTFVAYETLWDTQLPFTGSSPPEGFPYDPNDTKFYENFVSAQWRFCALRLRNHNGLQVHKDRILPFTSGKQIGGGGTAKVHRVEVHQEHDGITTSNKSAHYYAIKTFRSLDAEGNYERESRAFKQVTDAGAKIAPGLIEFHGSFEYRGTFNIILQYADGGTLEQLFKANNPPSSGEEIISFWSNLFETIKGLCRIHEQHLHTEGDQFRSSPGVLLQGWHQDLKPENFLVVSSSTTYPWSFKLADLGLCHFKTIMEGGPEAKDFDAFGTQTYGAPECYHMTEFSELQDNLVKRNIDIWSLGCIFSEAYTWVTKNWQGLDEFRSMRKRATDSIPNFRGGNCFHDGYELLGDVEEWLEDMRKDFKAEDFASGHVLDNMIYEMLDREPAKRPSAVNMEAKADRLVKTARRELRRASLRTPPTPSSAYTGTSATPDQGSRPTSSQVETQKNRSSSSPTTPPPLWGLGREPNVIYKTPQVSGLHHLPLSGAIPDQSIESIFHSAAPNSNTGDTQHALPSRNRSTKSQPLQSFGYHAHDSNAAPGAASSSQQHFQSDPIHPRTESRDDSLSPTSSGPSQHGLTLKTESTKSSANIPYCSLKEARAWYDKKKYGNGTAELPYHGLLPQLKGRDHVFLIDDSSTMAPHWDKVSELARLLTYITKKMDPDGVELYFLSSNRRYKFTKSIKLYETVRDHKPTAVTNLNLCFDDDLRGYAKEIEQTEQYNRSHSRSSRKLPRKRSIYVFTDGQLSSGEESQGHASIKVVVERLAETSLPRNQIGIQLISFGNNAHGLERLHKLDQLQKIHNLALDVVDTEPCDGNVWKMLLGAINERFDDVNEDDVLTSITSASTSP